MVAIRKGIDFFRAPVDKKVKKSHFRSTLREVVRRQSKGQDYIQVRVVLAHFCKIHSSLKWLFGVNNLSF